ncbi:hypothetical protein HDU79_011844, partial [Rhizoclosmatium sp. JEL0117]
MPQTHEHDSSDTRYIKLNNTFSSPSSSSSPPSSPYTAPIHPQGPKYSTVRRSFPDLSPAALPHLVTDPWYKFKLFVVKTKILESGVGVVIGRAFQDCIKSFVNDLLVPPILAFIPNRSGMRFIVLKQGRTKKRYKTIEEAVFDGAITINYGRFTHNCVNFFVVGVSVYYLLKAVKAFFENNLKHLRKCPYCVSEIPIEATRCSFCTSHLEPPKSPKPDLSDDDFSPERRKRLEDRTGD